MFLIAVLTLLVAFSAGEMLRPATPSATASGPALPPSGAPAPPPVQGGSSTPALIDSLNESALLNGASTDSSVGNLLTVTDASGSQWNLGGGIFFSSPGSANFTAANSPDFPTVAALLTDGLDEGIQVSAVTPSGAATGGGVPDSAWLLPRTVLAGQDLGLIRLVVYQVSFQPGTAPNGTYTYTLISENYSWQFWGHASDVAFASPTDSNGAYLFDRRDANVSVILAQPGTAVLQWNGANVSMNGSGQRWYAHVGGLANGPYMYRVWATNATGAVVASEVRTLTVGVGIWSASLGAGGFYASLAYDAASNPHVCSWNGPSASPNGLLYASHDASGWHVQSVVSTASGATTGFSCSLALDSLGRPHISFMMGPLANGSYAVSYAACNGSAWSVQLLAYAGPQNLAGSGQTSMVLDPTTGDPVIAFFRGPVPGLELMSFTGTRWVTQTVDPGFAGGAISLTVDSRGTLGIAYVSQSKLIWARPKGAGWTQTVVDTGALGGLPNSLSASFDALDQPRIAYVWGRPTVSTTAMKYAAFSGTAWSNVTVDDSPTGYGAMALDAVGRPHIAYTWGTGDLHYAVGGRVWSYQVVAGSEGNPGLGVAVAPDGTTGILYNSGTNDLVLLSCSTNCTPSEVRANLSGTGGTVGWFRSDVGVQLLPLENQSLVGNTSLRIDQGAWVSYTGSFTVSGEGAHVLEYNSTNPASGLTSWGTVPFGIDTVPPVASFLTPQAGSILHSSTVNVSWTATDAGSGIYAVEVSLDEPNVSAATLLTGNHIVLTGVANGNHTLRLWVFDFAGNVQSVALSFGVSVPPRPSTVPPAPSDLGLWVVAVIGAIVAVTAVGLVLYLRRRGRP